MTETTSSNSSEYDAELLLDALDKHIQNLNDRKHELERLAQDNLELAKARYVGGSLGAAVAMRTVTKKRALRAKTVGARFQLIDLKKTVQQELEASRQKSSGQEVAKMVL